MRYYHKLDAGVLIMTPSSSASLAGLRQLQASMFERILDQADPHAAGSPEVRYAQRTSARWIALRRLQLGFSTERLAQRIGAAPSDLSLLEAGLARPDQLEPASIGKLQHTLTRTPDDLSRIPRIVELALGHDCDPDHAIVAGVAADLEAACVAVEDEIASTSAEPAQPLAPVGALAPMVGLSSEEFSVLGALLGGERHLFAILQELSNRPDRSASFSAASLSQSIELLLTKHLIEQAGERTDPKLGPRKRQFFRVTASGRKAYEAQRATGSVAQELHRAPG